MCGLCRICSSNRKQFKSCGVNASCSSQQEAVKKLRCRCIMFFSSRKQLKSCGVFASFGYHQGSNFKVAFQCIVLFSVRKQLKICGVCASCGYRQGSSLKVALLRHHVLIHKEKVQNVCCQCIYSRSSVIVAVSVYELIIKRGTVF